MSMIFKIDRNLVAGKFHRGGLQITPEALLDPEELARYGLSHDEILELSPVLSGNHPTLFSWDHARDEFAATLRYSRFFSQLILRHSHTGFWMRLPSYTRVDFSGSTP
jgi:hypothetical protein